MKFTWEKKGLIFDINKHKLPNWASNSVLQPTPILISNGEVIRFYAGMRDDCGQSRIGFIDVLSKDPSQIIHVSDSPVLNLGEDGCFDDSGVVPSAVFQDSNGCCQMYFAGYSLLRKVRFSVLGGLARSVNTLDRFVRVSTVPVFERTDEHRLFRVPHSIIMESGTYKIWYGGGSAFFTMDSYTYPTYDVYYCETDDLAKIPNTSINVLTFENSDEYRVARPYVVKYNGSYCMFLCIATKSKGYRLGYAESIDGKEWVRCDENLGLDVSDSGWDSQMMGYPSFVETKYGTYIFYNGNDYGKCGFGFAKLKFIES